MRFSQCRFYILYNYFFAFNFYLILILATCSASLLRAQDGATGTEGTSDFNCGNLPSCVTSLPELRCVNDGDHEITSLTSGTNPVLLPMPQAATSPQNIVVFGNIIFNADYTFAPGSQIIVANERRFLVKNTIKLTLLEYTSIKGCENMWKGINVEFGGKIEARSTTIEDAFRGINILTNSSSSLSGSFITITDCMFNLCHYGVSIGEESNFYAFTRKINIAIGGFKNNKFNGDGVLKSNSLNLSNCYVGLHLNSITPFTIINCAFKNYGVDFPAATPSLVPRAINVYNCSSRLIGCDFSNVS